MYRMGEAYERLGLWTKAAAVYRKVIILYPDATIVDEDGPLASGLAEARLKALYEMGLVKERWWM